VNSFFLGCFAFGLIFTVASFMLGAFGSGHHLHLPGFDAHHGAGAPAGDHGAHVSPFNLSTISAFVTWFGGAGWLLTRYSSLTALLITLIASVAGTAGGGIVFVTLSRYVFPRLTVMRPEDYEVKGVVGRLASAIRAGDEGTGEVVYSVAGARRVDGARSLNGEAIEKGAEVVILRVEKGIAYVQRWDQFASQNQLPAGGAGET
jgi:hypothetical protein